MRLIFLGDSFTEGAYGGNWVALVARAFPQSEVINAGVGGDTVVNLRQRTDGVLAQHQPDAIFVMVGGNDAVSYTMPDTRLFYKSSKKVLPDGIVSPRRYESEYHALMSDLRQRGLQVFMGLSPVEFNRRLIEAHAEYNRIARRVASSLGIPTCDLETLLRPLSDIDRPAADLAFIQQIGRNMASGWRDFESERARWGYYYTFDGLHLMPEAAPIVAAHVTYFLHRQGLETPEAAL